MSFTDHRTKPRRALTEHECRSIANAALIYLAEQDPSKVLVIAASELLAISDRVGGDGLAISISDDDQWIKFGSAARVLSKRDQQLARGEPE